MNSTKLIAAAVLLFACTGEANAQLGKLGKALKDGKKVANEVGIDKKKSGKDSEPAAQPSPSSTQAKPESEPEEKKGFGAKLGEKMGVEEEASPKRYEINGTIYEEFPVFTPQYEDRTGISGTYYLSAGILQHPSSHFSSDPGRIYNGLTLQYDPDAHEMGLWFAEDAANFANVREEYKTSADRGNMLLMTANMGGPESLMMLDVMMLEQNVFLFAPNLYHVSEEEGHAWVERPAQIVLMAKDTTTFSKYRDDVDFTMQRAVEVMNAIADADKEESIANAKPLPAEGMKDAGLKSEALALIKRTAEGFKWKETVEYAYVMSNDWSISYHALTGAPLRRSAKCIVVMKTPEGDYKREGFTVAQEYNGSTYGKTFMVGNDQYILYVNPKEAMKYK